MKAIAAAIASALMIAQVNAQDESFRFFLSDHPRQEYQFSQQNPLIPGQARLYLYIQYGTNNQEFNGLNLRIDIFGGRFLGGQILNPTIAGAPRWQTITTPSPTVGSSTWSTGNVFKVGAAGFGARNVGPNLNLDGDFDGGDGSPFGTTLLGYMDVHCDTFLSNVFLQNGTTGNAGVTIGMNDFVYFGFGDAAVINRKGAAAGGAGGPTPLPEAINIPEPIMLGAILIAAAVVLRRRAG